MHVPAFSALIAVGLQELSPPVESHTLSVCETKQTPSTVNNPTGACQSTPPLEHLLALCGLSSQSLQPGLYQYPRWFPAALPGPGPGPGPGMELCPQGFLPGDSSLSLGLGHSACGAGGESLGSTHYSGSKPKDSINSSNLLSLF